jgi:hypothetical protein
MPLFRGHPAVRLSFLAIVLGAGGCCGFLGMWFIPVVTALVHGGFHDVGRLSVIETIFPAPPAFLELTRMQAELFKLASMLVGGAAFVVACIWASRYWSRLAVARGWMTAAEAKAFIERNDAC